MPEGQKAILDFIASNQRWIFFIRGWLLVVLVRSPAIIHVRRAVRRRPAEGYTFRIVAFFIWNPFLR